MAMEVDLADDLLRSAITEGSSITDEVKSTAIQRMRRLLLLADYARTSEDYEFMDRFGASSVLCGGRDVALVVLYIQFFVDLELAERLQYLKVSRGVTLMKGQILFNIGDPADSFYCVITGSLNVVIDITRVQVKRNMNDLLNRAKIYSCLHNPGVGVEESPYCTSYVVRNLKRFDSFGDVGMLTTDGTRTATVVACEDSFLLRIEREAFLDCRVFHESKDINQKMEFLDRIPTFRHWDRESKLKLCGRMERVLKSYNDVVVAQDDEPQHFYFIQLGACRLVKRVKGTTFVELGTLSSGQCFGSYEVVQGLHRTAYSVLVSSPSAILYRLDKLDFRHHILRDPIAEQMMQADAEDLYARMHAESIQRDLLVNAHWHKCKESILVQVMPRLQTRVPHLPPFNHGLHPSPLGQAIDVVPSAPRKQQQQHKSPHRRDDPPTPRRHVPPKQPNGGASPRGKRHLRPMSVDAAAQKLFLGHQHWIQWTADRANNVSLADLKNPGASSPHHPHHHHPHLPVHSAPLTTPHEHTVQHHGGAPKAFSPAALQHHLPETIAAALRTSRAVVEESDDDDDDE
ncbi:Aste57867_1124 [Aphanomyces stellatus]|uniref:Aste57867_1124 protein n=1 Tax=Aphanomyces stellatus TaxID=120398 RepID=A0A485K4L9_9STRA|nr:hypothetical protein As57867_001123 [Aphanomyces stellatus]VFT78345.1 Aste57867_1124 [Aphanomyces stellatus]